ncbi:MAG TPA: hypothetical protein VK447_04895, partial [Myxococcaceae bacterium]|nr:hypothetical protein [Myxococcaceae bacterium]
YMSPEQSRGQPVDARSDIYSFGVMLLELCTGRTAAEPRTELQRALRQRVQDPDGLLRRRLLQVSARCLEPEPFARFVDGTALLAELQAITREGDGVMLPRPRRRGRALRALLVMGVAVVLVVGGMLLAGWPRAFRLSSAPVRPAVRRLTANPPENAIEDAALSHDGRTLAYVDRRGLWLRRMDPVRTDAVKLPERFTPQAVSWFPKGDELLVVGLTPGVEGSAVWGITPSGKARLISERTLASARVAPDGSHIAWITPEGIAVAPPSMEGSWIVAPVERRKRLDRGFDQLAWSPDGKRLAYVRLSVGESGAEATLETVDLKSGRGVTLVSDPRLVLENGHAALAWGRDGRLFYALAERPPHESGSTLWVVVPDASTGEPSEPPRAVHSWVGSFPASLTASATGAMSYVLYESQVDVYAADLEEEGRRMATPRRITLTDHNEQPSAWTPDGQGVLFMSDQDGTHDLYLQNPVTGETRALVVEPESQAWPTLTPDGQQLLYWQQPVRDDDQPVPADLMRVPLAGGTPVRALTTQRASRELSALPPPGQAHVRCPRQGRTCLLAESDGSELVFTSFDPYTGNGGVVWRQEDSGGPHGWDVSADGERLVLPVRSGRLRTVELTGNKRSQDRIVDLGCDLQFATWAADGLGLFVTGICPGERPYKLFFVERNRSPRVLWESSYAWAGHPVPSPDGKSIALAIKPFDNDVWLLSGL